MIYKFLQVEYPGTTINRRHGFWKSWFSGKRESVHDYFNSRTNDWGHSTTIQVSSQ